MDLIDRQAALDCFHDWVDKRGDVHTADEIVEYGRIEALPAVERWKPLTLLNQCYVPELKEAPYGAVLVTYVTPKGRRRVTTMWVERGRIISKKINITPVAWMALPEPYKGEADG